MTVSTLPAVAFSYGGIDIPFDENRTVSLTSMWKAVGEPKSQQPWNWARTSQAKGFIENVSASYNLSKNQVMETRRGKGVAGTWAHWQVALAYAKYLSHDFHRLANEAFRQWHEEAADPGLKLERAASAYERRGKSPEWIGRRLEGVPARNALTRTMADHNCKVGGSDDNPYATMSRSVSLGATGRTPHELKAERGLSQSARTRDHYAGSELAAATLIETLIREEIVRRGSDGNEACLAVAREVSQAIGAVFRQYRPNATPTAA